ncbi:MlaE family ABC transporter permease [Mycobacteroides abscessus]|uniref:MlaE family ABC transporter permease n=1 Tax=Mycobacteroides abscessus TaxID=36809 RepID=UPI0009CE8154|nr:ABC transporter permease [Mycobacteroides abscessus]SLA40785.1 organic solvents resistance ABC transporter permease [Mycobacteroides abscessus subsp. massiliense]
MKAGSMRSDHGLARTFGSSFATLGRTATLTASALGHLVTDIARLRLPAREVVQQAWFLYTVTAFPALLMAIPFGVIVNLQIGGLLNDVGAQSMTGAAAGIGILRQGAPICSALLMGGAAASAVASDLGTRSVREEIDAMRVLGINPVQRLVVPRLLAMFIVAPMILATVILVGIASAYMVAVTFGNVSSGSFWASFGAYATTTDLVFALLKVLVSGLLVVIISSLRGMETRGGPREVAESVNAAVVLSIVASVFAVLALTQVQNIFVVGPSE